MANNFALSILNIKSHKGLTCEKFHEFIVVDIGVVVF